MSVSSLPGVFPEKDLLTMVGGQVSAIGRARASSQVAAGQVVLTDTELAALGAAYSDIVQVLPKRRSDPRGQAPAAQFRMEAARGRPNPHL